MRESERAYLIFEGDSIVKCGHVSFSEYDRIINHHSSCRDTVLVDPILVGQVLAQKVPHNEFFVEWAKELGFS